MTLFSETATGLNGKFAIQPEYQRNHLYTKAKIEEAVINLILNGYLIGLFTVKTKNVHNHYFILFQSTKRIKTKNYSLNR